MLDSIVRSPETLQREYERAARYEGRAAAMVVNLAGLNPQRAAVWETEESAWHERKAAALTALPLNAYKDAAYRTAVEIAQTSFFDNLVSKPPEVHAA